VVAAAAVIDRRAVGALALWLFLPWARWVEAHRR
jgi:hypothetical protein